MAGLAVPNVLLPELIEVVVAQGSTPLENGTTDFLFYGYNGDGPRLPRSRPFHAGWRVFYTQLHGDNVTYELLHTHQ
jgi:hypothetical protein